MSNTGTVYKRCGCRDVATGRPTGSGCPRLADRGHGSWYFSLDLPYPAARRRVRRGGYASRAAAREAMKKLVDTGAPDSRGAGLTVGEWLDYWVRTRTGPRDSTVIGYECHIRRHLRPYLGRVLLAELSPGDIQEALERLGHGSATDEGVSAATVQRVRATLRAALNAAVRAGYLESNPTRGVVLPSGQRPFPVVWTPQAQREWARSGRHPAVAVWSVEQTAAFLRFVSGDRLYAAFHLIALVGLRRGEAIGLRWGDIDWQGQALSVSRQVQRHGGRNMVSVPKSAASRRTVALDHATVAALRRHQCAQKREAQAAGHRWEPDGYVFTAPRGNVLAPDSLTRLFQRRLRQSGLPPVRLHDLRHGAASLALAAGADLKVVQAMLGHASIVVTADTYASVLPEMAHAAAEETAALVLAGMHGKKDRAARSRRTRAGGVSSGPRRGIHARRIQRDRPPAER